jgi:hypothetical protein
MKNLFISAGLVAVSAASVQSVLADDAPISATPKNWSVQATLRGFYDDNYSIGTSKKGSAGVEFSPSATINFSLPQTDFGIRYTYGLYYYQQRQDDGVNPFDQSHQLDVWLDHAFDERWKVHVTDTLGVGQEPELTGDLGAPFRVDGDNIGNHFNIDLDTQWTRQFSTVLRYGNDFYDYQNDGTASLAASLNRVDQNAGLDLQWSFQPETTGFVGYTFDWVDYTANELLGFGGYTSDSRNLLMHQVHAGVNHQFTSNLSGSASFGANYADNYNDPNSNPSWSPYAQISLTYTYLPGSYAQIGFTHDINATDVSQASNSGNLTQYQESSILYGSINHRITEKLLASLTAQVMYSDYHGGDSGVGADVYYSLGANLSYQFNRYLSADVGYNYDDLESDVAGRPYSRNRVYLGMTVNY